MKLKRKDYRKFYITITDANGLIMLNVSLEQLAYMARYDADSYYKFADIRMSVIEK